MSSPTDFLSLVVAGKAQVGEIDDFIDQWHDGTSTLELHEFLGLSRDQYRLWLERPEALAEFCRARRDPSPPGRDFDQQGDTDRSRLPKRVAADEHMGRDKGNRRAG